MEYNLLHCTIFDRCLHSLASTETFHQLLAQNIYYIMDQKLNKSKQLVIYIPIVMLVLADTSTPSSTLTVQV